MTAESFSIDQSAPPKLDEVFSIVYEELRRLASSMRRGESSSTISSTALVNEAWLKLRHSPALADTSPAHFRGIAARAMREVLVEQARRRQRRKRGGGGEASIVSLEDVAEPVRSSDRELLALDSALNELAQVNSRQANIVEHRFFGGLSVAETASLLQVSESVVERDWRAAKAWLATKIRPAG